MRRHVAAVAGLLAIALSACAAAGTDERGAMSEDGRLSSAILLEPVPIAGIAAEDPADLSLAISQRTFASAEVLILSSPEDLTEASDRAAELGAPLLVLPSDPSAEQIAAVTAEASRLGPAVTVTFGVELSEELAAIAPGEDEAGPVKWPEPVSPVAWTALTPEPAAVPWLEPLVYAAGGSVAAMPHDPRASADAVSTAAALSGPIVTVGEGYGSAEEFEWRWLTAAGGAQLPGGGQLVANGQFYVALYGHPGAPTLGVLGEQDLPAAITRVQEHADAYEGLVPGPIVPTMEIITTVASAGAGPDGNYSNEARIDDLVPWVEAAGEAGMYVVLDLQPGRTDFLTQAMAYEPLLLYPHVGLALDPEWRLGPNQVHLAQIGSVSAAEVNQVATWLADLTRANHLPQKMFILHSFTTRMVTDVDTLDVSRPELAWVMHVDGQGAQGAKIGTWNNLRSYASVIPHWGWKNFYDEDTPAILTPAETIANVSPTPLLVTYQ